MIHSPASTRTFQGVPASGRSTCSMGNLQAELLVKIYWVFTATTLGTAVPVVPSAAHKLFTICLWLQTHVGCCKPGHQEVQGLCLLYSMAESQIGGLIYFEFSLVIYPG